ncbi:MAG TPA: NADH-quinone oxidoreductase subunit L, partial [Planctomycetota bacterium]|nr:NADH-quinone oxidoreductase subunit L [Planctomycetota bacterium]
METAVVLIPLLPFAGFILNGLAGKRMGKGFTAMVACAGPVASFFCALSIFLHMRRTGAASVDATLYTWIKASDLTVPFRLYVDHLSILMCLVVTGIGSLIHIYSTEYMEHEPRGGYARYFAYLNLFTSFMLVLVTGASLPLMFVGWEGVGLASYLLIGFWYTNEAYANAGKKAFIVNRIGDFGFLIGIFLLFTAFPQRTLDMQELNGLAAGHDVNSSVLTTAAVCLFIGACGKSAQIPLYVWLPDAMAGPTPVSALIHAATMVTAGVYMILRMHVLFEHAPGALALVATIGCATAFFAATMGLAENDLKTVLAYSTVSQLGYMFVGVGTGAFTAGFFHVFTHAFFKALLFLGAGVVMHALDGITDLRKMGGLREKLPLTYWLFLAGALALAGIPPFAGFFSKDEILWSALARFSEGGGGGWLAIWIVG